MKWKQWKLGLLVSIITGIATAFAVGVVVPTMTLKQGLFVCLGCIGKDLLLYLKQHPADQIDFNSKPPFPLSDGSNVKPPEPQTPKQETK